MTASQRQQTRILPRPLLRIAWLLHRSFYRFSAGRFGLSQPQAGDRFGMMQVATVGRRSGRPRTAIVGYFEDGANLVTLAMNGWGEADPAWWLNLQAVPDAVVALPSGSRSVRARAAQGAERDRLWSRLREFPGWGDDIDTITRRRTTPTTVVVFEPRYEVDALPDGRARSASDPAPRDVLTLGAEATDRTERRVQLRARHLWIVAGLGIAVVANTEAHRLGLGILPLLAFGIAPDLPRLLGVGQRHRPGQMARRAVPPFNLMHHPVVPIALLGAAALGVLPPIFYVGALAWLGHVVVGLGVGDRVRDRDGFLRPLRATSRSVGYAGTDRGAPAAAPASSPMEA